MSDAIVKTIARHGDQLTANEARLQSLAIAVERLQEIAACLQFQHPEHAARVTALARDLRERLYRRLGER